MAAFSLKVRLGEWKGSTGKPIKNVVNIVGREQPGLDTEAFCQAVAGRFLDHYPQVALAEVTAHETKWTRLTIDGKPHPHSFYRDGEAGDASSHLRLAFCKSRATIEQALERLESWAAPRR